MKPLNTPWKIGEIRNIGSSKRLIVTNRFEVAKGKFNYLLESAITGQKYIYTYEKGLMRI